MQLTAFSLSRARQPRILYGWTIVGVGFLSQMVCAFHLSRTLSVFVKPLSEELGVSRGLFSLLRSGAIVIGAVQTDAACGLGMLITLSFAAAGLSAGT